MASLPAQQYQLPFRGYEPHPGIQDAYLMHPANGGAPLLFDGPSSANMRALIDQTPQVDNRLALGDDKAAIQSAMRAPFDAALPQAAPSYTPGGSLSMQIAPQAPQADASLAHLASEDPRKVIAAQKQGMQGMPVVDMAALSPQMQAAAKAPENFTPPMNAPVGQVAGAAPQVPSGPRQINLDSPQGEAQSGQPQEHTNLDNYIEQYTTEGGWHPTSKAVSVKGGVQDPKELAAFARAYGEAQIAEEQAAANEKLALQAAADANNTAFVEEKNKQLGLEAQQAQRLARQQQVDEQYGTLMQKAQDDLAKMSAREVQPNRIYEGKPGAQIMAALAASLGAFGASLNHTPNFAMDFINKQIDRDIDAQRDEINRGVSAKQNDIARIRDKYNVSTNTAEKIAALQATEYAGVMARKQASMLGGQNAQIALAKIDQQLAQSKLARLKDLHNTISGEVETKSDEKYSQGGTGYRVKPIVEAREKVAKSLGGTAQGLSTAEHEGQAPGKQGAGGAGKMAASIARQQAIAKTAHSELDKIIAKDPGGWFIAPNAGEGALKSDKRVKYEQAVNASVGKVITGLGEGMSKENKEELQHNLNSPNPLVRKEAGEQLRANMAITVEALEATRGNAVANTGEGDSE